MAQSKLILFGDGGTTWRILGPSYAFGERYGDVGPEDRRYEELAVVHGHLGDALDRLHELEKGRA